MGYESKVYIVQESTSGYVDHDGLVWGDVVAMFDLCRMGWESYYGKTFSQLFDQERTCYFYSDDGNTQIVDDKYGDPIQKADKKEVIKWLRKFCKENEWYRAKLLLSCLETLEKSGEAYSVYHFGY